MTRSLLPTAALVAALMAGASAFAQDTMSVRVDYSDVNLGSSAGAQVFHKRLQNAVEEICGTTDVRNLAASAAVQKCQRDAWANAAQAERQATADARGPIKMALAAPNPFAR